MKFKVIYENPETKNRDAVVLSDEEHRILMADLFASKQGQPVLFKGYGKLTKTAYKGSVVIDGETKERAQTITVEGKRELAYSVQVTGADGRKEWETQYFPLSEEEWKKSLQDGWWQENRWKYVIDSEVKKTNQTPTPML